MEMGTGYCCAKEMNGLAGPFVAGSRHGVEARVRGRKGMAKDRWGTDVKTSF